MGGVIDGLVNLVGLGLMALSRVYRLVDLYVVDGFVNLVGWATTSLGGVLWYVQTGRPQNYLLAIALGVIVLSIVAVLR